MGGGGGQWMRLEREEGRGLELGVGAEHSIWCQTTFPVTVSVPDAWTCYHAFHLCHCHWQFPPFFFWCTLSRGRGSLWRGWGYIR